ncbi:MAG: hypothetical protein IGS39_21430 [Calothrix sp. C42_A2020_038]|nr:hypothetical protein [Calothrix sp. C42_A2020_038]
MTTFDNGDRLQYLAVAVQNQPPESSQRHRALGLLIQELGKQPTVGVLRKNLKKKYWSLMDGLFEELFNEALQDTFIAISRGIDKYDCQRPLLPLVCKIVSNKFSYLHKKYTRSGITNIPKSQDNTHSHFKLGQIISLDGLEDFAHDNVIGEYVLYVQDKVLSDRDLLRELLINDPDNIFKTSHIRNQPHITFQYLAISLYIEGKNMQQLSKELKVHYQTLNSFFKRKLEKLEPYFREYLGA